MMQGNSQLYRATGVTKAERYLQRLCEQTFLSLWSYSGIYRNQGGGGAGGGQGKEVCDLLVVFDNHILIFSDKDCAFPNTGNLVLDWTRWFRHAVLKSAEQVWGAERWIKTHPDRLFLDPACKQPFPISLPDAASAKYHRIVVAHNASRRCKAELGGSGSLLIDSNLIGSAHFTGNSADIKPFVIGNIDPAKGYVHVFDDTSLNIVMSVLDTVSDFVSYLEKKETLITARKPSILAAGEEELLSQYLINLNDAGEHDFVFDENYDLFFFDEGHWEKFTHNPQRHAQLEANKISYAWDALIEVFNKHMIAGTQYHTTDRDVRSTERIVRFMARESRTRRRQLAKSILELIEKTPKSYKAVRVGVPVSPGDPYYVFLLLPQLSTISYEEYRTGRREFMVAYCEAVKFKFPDAQDIVCLATESGRTEEGSEDALYFDARHWTAEQQAQARILYEEHGFLRETTSFHWREHEYPDTYVSGPVNSTPKLRMKGRDRNIPCPCGSGKKFKNCCGRKTEWG